MNYNLHVIVERRVCFYFNCILTNEIHYIFSYFSLLRVI